MQSVICDNSKKSFDGCGWGNKGVVWKSINFFLLMKVSTNLSCFIFLDISINISLALKNLFFDKNMLMFRAVN